MKTRHKKIQVDALKSEITERKKVEQVLLETKQRVEEKNKLLQTLSDDIQNKNETLEKVNHELDNFVHTASHDLRTPLRQIVSYSGLLSAKYKDQLDEEGRHYLKEISNGGKRMGDLIKDLLTLSRISRINHPYEEVRVDALLTTVLERVDHDIKETDAQVTVLNTLPTIVCDRVKMAEVFANLITNAIKFSSGNGEKPKVDIGWNDQKDVYQFFVRDNGIGIEQQYQDEIFEVFKRLHTTDEYDGTGAGLNIARKAVEGHGGKIWVVSEPGEGACFFFTIPKHL